MRITNWVVAATQSSSGSNDRLFFSDGEPKREMTAGTQSRKFLDCFQRGVFVRPNVVDKPRPQGVGLIARLGGTGEQRENQ